MARRSRRRIGTHLAGEEHEAGWLDRLMLGQMALKLSREHVTGVHAVRQSDLLALFTNELTLNYQNPLVGHIWQGAAMRWRPALTGPVHSGHNQSFATAVEIADNLA